MEAYKAALVNILKEESKNYSQAVQGLVNDLDEFNCNLLRILSESQDFSSEVPLREM